MQIFHQKKKLAALIGKRQNRTKIVGFVPTMGALHQGHFSLIEKAQSESDVVVVSIFVNPTQFDNPSDLENYPKHIGRDVKRLEKYFKGIVVFVPNAREVYGEEILSEEFDFGPLAEKMEGKFRTGHFDGVGTVLKKLFEIVVPDKAFFGEKDYQQFLIVKKLVTLTGQPVEIIGCPISRQKNGLARSSRNKRLTKQQRKEATLLYKCLNYAKTEFGTKNVNHIMEKVREKLDKAPFFHLEYFKIADAKTLETAKTVETNKNYRAFIAVQFHGVRLIDNMPLN